VAWISACVALLAGPAGRAQEDADLKKAADRYWEAVVERSPTFATAIGDYRFNDRLDDVSEEALERWKSALNGLLREVHQIPTDRLSPADRLTQELLKRAISDSLLRIECHTHLTPLEPLDGPHIQLPLLLVSQPFRNADDFRAYMARLRGFRKQVTDLIANMRKGVGLGVVSPRVVVEKTVPQIRAHIVADVAKSEFYSPMNKAGALSDSERPEIEQKLREVIAADVVPAYLQLLGFVEDEYLPRCRDSVGVGAVPNGRKIYEALAYLNTTVRLDVEEIHALGLSEVARIREEMAKVQKEVSFEGSLDEFLTHMRTDPKHRFGSAEELVSSADGILRRIKPRLPELFGRLPEADCVMKEIEPFRAPAAPVAYYNNPPEDRSRPGYYYINTYAPNERLRFTLEALTYHEAVPGHHLQIALHQESLALPKFRRYASFTAYVEGWALYAEKLGFDIGGYADPYSRFGQLTFEMWRACRLVVDSGMHAKGWTREQAIEFMAKNTSLARIDTEAEIDRYIAWPGQALAYKIGEICISGLRREAQQKLGNKFDLRAFHDALLADGAMPIDMLENRMREWIARQTP
jgi:prolyl oligopeptidase